MCRRGVRRTRCVEALGRVARSLQAITDLGRGPVQLDHQRRAVLGEEPLRATEHIALGALDVELDHVRGRSARGEGTCAPSQTAPEW